jgi:hypothetical protein
MHVVVHPADVQERDGGILVLATLFGLYLRWSPNPGQVAKRESRP